MNNTAAAASTILLTLRFLVALYPWRTRVLPFLTLTLL